VSTDVTPTDESLENTQEEIIKAVEETNPQVDIEINAEQASIAA